MAISQMTQCTLRKPHTNSGYIQKVVWIPKQFAIMNKVLQIKQSETWINGWLVVEVGQSMESKFVIERERDYLKQRDVSDI